ncbi:hypothetical protein NHX12_026256 [Muraenolepis orangiensis]|uniref:Uncharacterized protein n=1 Tax=Muraenolepis orangiensis TaxID=630683 RepID=A0A9Q0ELY2_9TELE|nr:hypothetical protein NHX12_026256 [Muraenolepis orangiensis]
MFAGAPLNSSGCTSSRTRCGSSNPALFRSLPLHLELLLLDQNRLRRLPFNLLGNLSSPEGRGEGPEAGEGSPDREPLGVRPERP